MDPLIENIINRSVIPDDLVNPRNIFIALIKAAVSGMNATVEIVMDNIIVFIGSMPFVFNESEFSDAVVSIMNGVYGEIVDNAIIHVKGTIMEVITPVESLHHDGVLSKSLEHSIAKLIAGQTPSKGILGTAIIRDLGHDVLDDKLHSIMNDLTSSEILAKYFAKDEIVAKIIIDNMHEQKIKESAKLHGILDTYKMLFDKMLKINTKLTKIISTSARPQTPPVASRAGKGDPVIENKGMVDPRYFVQGERSINE
jgi:hypothetical protein